MLTAGSVSLETGIKVAVTFTFPCRFLRIQGDECWPSACGSRMAVIVITV